MRRRRLALLPGNPRKWEGHVDIVSARPDGWVCHFDAFDGVEYIYDVLVLTASTIRAMTGVDLLESGE